MPILSHHRLGPPFLAGVAGTPVRLSSMDAKPLMLRGSECLHLRLYLAPKACEHQRLVSSKGLWAAKAREHQRLVSSKGLWAAKACEQQRLVSTKGLWAPKACEQQTLRSSKRLWAAKACEQQRLVSGPAGRMKWTSGEFPYQAQIVLKDSEERSNHVRGHPKGDEHHLRGCLT